MKIYEKIFARLEELHMSQTELSRRTGIATSTISDWRKKQINPQADKLVSICKALDMTLVELLCDEENAEQTATNDYITDENKQDVINRYRKQLDLYADALTKLSGKKVKEKYLYLFNIDKEVKL